MLTKKKKITIKQKFLEMYVVKNFKQRNKKLK